MPIEPNIALGVRGIELQNPLAQYGQIAAIQNAQNQNQLAQFQLGAAQRQDVIQNALNTAYQKNTDPKTGVVDFAGVRRDLAQGGAGSQIPGQLKLEREAEKAKLEQQKAETDLVDSKLKQSRQFLDTLDPIKDPNGAAQQYLSWHEANHRDPILGPVLTAYGIDPANSRANIMKAVAQGPQALADAINRSKLGNEKFMEMNKPVTFAQDTGSGGRVLSRAGLGGEASVIPGTEFTKTQTFADRNASARLAFDQAKFAWEKANPTMSIQEDPSGLLAVNTRTGMATPVVYGPTGFQAAPAAAPAAGPSVMRQQGAGMPGQRVAAIPGMTSVLDQTAAPAASAAMPMPSEGGVRVAGAPVGSKREAPAKFNDTDMQLAGLAGSLKEFKDEVGKNLFTGAKFVPSGSDTARMQAKYTALLMGVKDLYALGALAGPDMSIIESQLTNPASWSGKFTSKKGFEEQVKVIEDMLKRTTTNLESTYNRTPKASKKAIEAMSSGADAGVDTSNPLLR